MVSEADDKNTVISLREIGEGKISIKTIEDSAINKLRKVQIEPKELEDLEIEKDDDFDKIYKGEISKSGAAILPSKRVRKSPEKNTTIFKVEKENEEKVREANQHTKNEVKPTQNKTE